MASLPIKPSRLGRAVAVKVMERLSRGGFEQIVVSQAQRRIANGGDSQHTYPDLWDPPFPARRRAGDQPLRDSGRGMSTLNGRSETKTTRGTLTLSIQLRGLLYMVYHQHGFETDGPNFIPLTNKAFITHVKGRNPNEEGLEPGVDFIMAWNGVSVPQRKVFNTPPEDVAELRDAIVEAIANG